MESFHKKPNWVRGIRCAYGYSAKQISSELGISETNYRKKEAGNVGFSDKEKVALAKIFSLSIWQVNSIFFNGELPSGNNRVPDGTSEIPFTI